MTNLVSTDAHRVQKSICYSSVLWIWCRVFLSWERITGTIVHCGFWHRRPFPVVFGKQVGVMLVLYVITSMKEDDKSNEEEYREQDPSCTGQHPKFWSVQASNQ